MSTLALWTCDIVREWLEGQPSFRCLLPLMPASEMFTDICRLFFDPDSLHLQPCYVQGITGSDLAALTDAALQQAGVKSRLLRRQLLNRRDELLLEAEGDEPEVGETSPRQTK